MKLETILLVKDKQKVLFNKSDFDDGAECCEGWKIADKSKKDKPAKKESYSAIHDEPIPELPDLNGMDEKQAKSTLEAYAREHLRIEIDKRKGLPGIIESLSEAFKKQSNTAK